MTGRADAGTLRAMTLAMYGGTSYVDSGSGSLLVTLTVLMPVVALVAAIVLVLSFRARRARSAPPRRDAD